MHIFGATACPSDQPAVVATSKLSNQTESVKPNAPEPDSGDAG